MQPLLYLCHRIPYPPNKGDKIRSYNMLKFLSQHYDVYLGTFVDDAEDFQYTSIVEELCKSSCILPLNPTLGKIKSLTGFIKGCALGLPYYANRKMQNWVDSVLAEHDSINCLVFSSTMAQYVSGKKYSPLKRYIDFIDIDSDKWAQYQTQASPVMKLVYGYESKKLFEWERKIAKEFDASFFVSEQESDLFKQMVPEAVEKISYFNNGVDTDYFSPDNRYETPYDNGCKAIVFTGAMNYWANVDAVVWFANEVLPAVSEKIPDVKFYIVGFKPDEKVTALAESPHVVVTGAVDDVRPYLAYATVAVAPMHIARGVQNKVLEAMAMAIPTITTQQGYEGINATRNKELMVVDGTQAWIDELNKLLINRPCDDMATAARACVLKSYSWQSSLMRLMQKMQQPEQGAES